MRNCTTLLALFAGLVLALGTSAQAELIGYWNFDNSGDRYQETSGWAQSAAGGNQAAGYHDAEDVPISEQGVTATPQFNSTNGIIGYYVDMTGAGNEALRLKNTTSVAGGSFSNQLDNTQEGAIACWVYGWPGADGDFFVGKEPRGDTSNHRVALKRQDANDAAFQWDNKRRTGDGNLGDGAWHHLVGTADDTGSTGTKLYVDGKLAQVDWRETNYFRDAADDEYFSIGARQWKEGSGDDWQWFSNVKIDDVGVWNDTIFAKEIAAIHAMGRFEAIGLMDSGVTDLIAAFDATGSTTINGNNWTYTDLSGLSTIMGDTGGSAGTDAWVVLDANGNGMQITPAGPVIPEPSTLAIWALGLLGLLGWMRLRKK